MFQDTKGNSTCSYRRPATGIVSSLLLALLLLLQFSLVTHAGDDLPGPNVQEAALSENWSAVRGLLDSVNRDTPSPLLRIIKAHADLAENRNNSAFSLFVQLTPEDLEAWMSWSEALASQHGAKSLSYYFLGDACARARELGRAYAQFTKAVELNPANYLAWNARGVTSALRGDYEGSHADFTRALSIKPEFIDAVNNIGMMRIAQQEGRKGAMAYFAAAIKADPNFALAYHGLGCMELLSAQTLAPNDNLNIQKSFELCPDAEQLYILNIESFATAFSKKRGDTVVADAGDEGAFINKSWQHKQARIDGALKELSHSREFYETNKLNPFLSRAAKSQYDFAKQSFATVTQQTGQAEIDQMDRGLRSGVANEYSRVQSSMADTQSLAKASGHFARSMGIALDSAALAAGAMRNPPAAAAFKVGKIVQDAVGIDKRAGEIGQNAGHLAGAFRTERTRWDPVGINQPMGNQGQVQRDPGGATTAKAQITWDEHEWPFLPMFGLLYFAAPQPVAPTGSQP